MLTNKPTVAKLSVLALLAFLLGFAFSPLSARLTQADAFTVTTNMETPVDVVIFVSCTLENVHFMGTIHEVFHSTLDSTGGAHVVEEFNYQDVSGVGQVSGYLYRAINSGQQQFNLPGPPPSEFTSVRTLMYISQGRLPNFALKQTVHFTVNANGTMTADVFNFEVECRGH